MKKILFLGGSTQQIPAIKYAKQKGYYSILCDYLSDNPGQYVSDEFFCVSTTDKEAILKVSSENNIDAIVAYASDPAASTAAYVGNKLNLQSNPYESVEILSKKNLFREFLKENKFNCPKSKSFKTYIDAMKHISLFKFPIMVKPIDSSGSKGVIKVNKIEEFEAAFKIAMSNSRERVIIIEEFIESSHDYMIAGDAFVVDGQVVFWGLLNSHRNKKVNPFVPIGTSYPTFLPNEKVDKVKKEVQRVVDILAIKSGALNLELMFDKNEDLYIIEIGPRNGGNMIPDLLYMATDIDMIGATVEASLNNYIDINKKEVNNKYISTYVIHSSKNGVLKDIKFTEEIEKKLIKQVMYKNIGDTVEKFDGANKALGIVFLEYDNIEEMNYKMSKMSKYIKIIVE